MAYDKLGKVAIRFAVKYVRRRYRRQIRIGVGVTVVAVGIAAYAASRKVTCRDLWAYLWDSDAAAVITATGISHVAVLFRLCHGSDPAQLDTLYTGDVHVVLRNDHYTTQQFVCGMLRDVFELADSRAQAIMLATHATGRAVIGRFTAADARMKIGQARALASAQAFPLWIGVEPT